MNWWGCFVLAFAGAMMTTWMIGPPVSYGGLLMWYIYDMLPSERPYTLAIMRAWLVKHPKEEYVTLHGSVLVKSIIDIVNLARDGWTDDDIEGAIKGLFTAADAGGGTIDDIDHLRVLLERTRPGIPGGTVSH